MTSLIKSTDAGQTRVGPAQLQAASAAGAEQRPSPLEIALADAHEKNARLEAEIVTLKAKAAAEIKQAHEAGAAEGRAAETRQAEEALSRLSLGIAAAQETFSARLASIDALAVVLAECGLARVIGDPEIGRRLLHETICFGVERFRNEGVLSVEVSATDFPDPEALSALSGALSGVDVIPSDDLAQGECRLRMRLGEIDVGLASQWDHLRQALAELAAEGGAP